MATRRMSATGARSAGRDASADPAGTTRYTTHIATSASTNQCRIALHRPMDADTLVVLAVEDNLVKGAAGQAVQNMNLMFGFPESQGLEQIAVVP